MFVLAIDPYRRVWTRCNNGPWENKQTKKWAAGSGADYALGALWAGKSATEAVMIASQLDVHTGLGTNTLHYEPK